MDAWRRDPARSESSQLPWRLLSALVAVRLGLYLLSSGPLAYGTMSDEFYYADCAERLAWGYVDHPPLSIAVLAASRAWFGDTAAVNFLGRARGLPRAISGHNNNWLWGPGGASGEVLLALAGSDERLHEWYQDVRRVAEIDCEFCMPDVARMGVYVCRRPRRPIAQWWPEAKIYR